MYRCLIKSRIRWKEAGKTTEHRRDQKTQHQTETRAAGPTAEEQPKRGRLSLSELIMALSLLFPSAFRASPASLHLHARLAGTKLLLFLPL